MTDPHPRTGESRVSALLELYDNALPEVYGYVRRRVDSDQAAEDVTAETFLAAVTTLKSGTGDNQAAASLPWLIGVARHKVVDHWRRCERDQRRVDALTQAASVPGRANSVEAASDLVIDVQLAEGAMAQLSPSHRAVLTLRYLDDLPVKQVAEHLGRSAGATEALLTRAKAAFRQHYPDPSQPGPTVQPDQRKETR